MTSVGYRPWRVPLQIRYEGREFGTISLEVAIDGGVGEHQQLIMPEGIELAAFEIDPPRLVPCFDVPHQIAQKLHACTEPLPEGNDRVRDVLDLWLLEALLEPDDWPTLQEACVATFQRRQRHAWPPVITPSGSWERDYALLIGEHPEAPATIDLAVEYLTQLIAKIEQS